ARPTRPSIRRSEARMNRIVTVEDDRRASKLSRQANWARVRTDAGGQGWTPWTLQGVSPPRGQLRSQMLLREDPVTQEMERVMIALLGVTGANSAPSGFYYPWDTSIYDPMLNDMLKEFQTAEAENPDAAAQLNASVSKRLTLQRNSVKNSFNKVFGDLSF
ncbi:hypothetical protein OC845_006710, partial [Tilletia horrida]